MKSWTAIPKWSAQVTDTKTALTRQPQSNGHRVSQTQHRLRSELIIVAMDTSPVSGSSGDWGNVLRPIMFSGLRSVDVGDEPEVGLGSGYSLVKPNELILSARQRSVMTGSEFLAAEDASRYLVYTPDVPPFPRQRPEEIKSLFHCGMLGLQILKPVPTLGLVFYGDHTPSGRFSLAGKIERRPPMEAGPWALDRPFDSEFLKAVPRMISGVQAIMGGPSAEKKNAIHLLQLGLEHFHPLISGLLWVMGLDAIFDSGGAAKFKKDLCAYLGCQTPVYPPWNAAQPTWTVGDIAGELYVMRNKLVHGVDLRKATTDRKFPVDLVAKQSLLSSSDTAPMALLLSEAACYLLCQVLQKEIGQP